MLCKNSYMILNEIWTLNMVCDINKNTFKQIKYSIIPLVRTWCQVTFYVNDVCGLCSCVSKSKQPQAEIFPPAAACFLFVVFIIFTTVPVLVVVRVTLI